jgi:hypothetical protein
MNTNEQTTLEVVYTLGLKVFQMHQGFAAIFNLCLRTGLFTNAQFHEELGRVSENAELRDFADLLESLHTAKEQEDLEEALKKYKGPIQ